MPEHEPFAPRIVGNELVPTSLTGKLFPYRDGSPVLVAVAGCDDLFIPFFTDEGELRSVLGRLDIAFDRIKQVTDETEFLPSLPIVLPSGAALRLLLDPWFTETGTIRYVEVFRPAHEA